MRSYIIADDGEEEVNCVPFNVPLHALYASRDLYANYPAFQREEVWPDKFKAELIDTLVRGLYVPEIVLTERPDARGQYWVVDGQQRQETMLQFMAAMEADKHGRPIPRDQEGNEYFYFRLNERQQQRLRNRKIRFVEVQNVTDKGLSTTFLRVQNQIPLTTGEKLWASPSAIRQVAEATWEHPFFSTIYEPRARRKPKRKQQFQLAFYPASVEMFKPFADLTSSRLKQLATGWRSDLVYAGMPEIIKRRLDHALRLFSSCRISAMSEMIIVYQAIWLLDFIGADLGKTPEDALTPWYRNVEAINQESRSKGFMNLFAQFTNHKVQRHWWLRWLDDIVYGANVEFKNAEAALAQLQRFTGWLKADGICPACNNTHVRLQDVNQHVFRPADAHNPARLPECQAARSLCAIA